MTRQKAHAVVLKINVTNSMLDNLITNVPMVYHNKRTDKTGLKEQEYFSEDYEYTWEKPFVKKRLSVGVEKSVTFQVATARIEFPRRVKSRDGMLLARNERVNVNQPDVVLFSTDSGSSYMAVITSYLPDVERVVKLFGEDKVERIEGDELLTDSFFVWVYYHFQKSLDILPSLNLNNITGFTGIVSDPTNTIVGSSDNTADLIITKAFVSNKNPLKSLKLDLLDNVMGTLMMLSEDREVTIDVSRTQFILAEDYSEEEKILYAIAYIYTALLPELLIKYASESMEFENQNRDFSKEIGLDVIESIVKLNDISLEDLLQKVDFRDQTGSKAINVSTKD